MRLLKRKNLARTSNVPGKTQQMNYYKVGETCYLVDLPGYGYAKVPKERTGAMGGKHTRLFDEERNTYAWYFM